VVHAIKWQLQHRYMQVEAMAELFSPANEQRQLPSAAWRQMEPGSLHLALQWPDCRVDGTYARRSTVASPSTSRSRAAVRQRRRTWWRRSRSQHHVLCRPSHQWYADHQSHRRRCVNERFHYTANLHPLDGRDHTQV